MKDLLFDVPNSRGHCLQRATSWGQGATRLGLEIDAIPKANSIDTASNASEAAISPPAVSRNLPKMAKVKFVSGRAGANQKWSSCRYTGRTSSV